VINESGDDHRTKWVRGSEAHDQINRWPVKAFLTGLLVDSARDDRRIGDRDDGNLNAAEAEVLVCSQPTMPCWSSEYYAARGESSFG
jgi:hypothetical protein